MDVDDSFINLSKINRFREVEWRQFLSDQGMPGRMITNIKPFLRKVEALTSYDLPHYLFRVWSDRSAGFNCEHGEHKFQSQAAKAGLGATGFDLMEEAEIKDNLSKHLRWKRGPKSAPFHGYWISFTCSLLFALVHAWREALMRKKNIMFAVIDTYKIKEPGRIFSAFPLIRAYDIQDLEIKDSAYAEFLAYDNFEAEMDVIPFSALLRPTPDFPGSWPPGLLDLCPFLKYSEAEMREARRQALKFNAKDLILRLKSRIKKLREQRFPDLEILQVNDHERAVKSVLPWRMAQGKRVSRFPMSQKSLESFYRLVRPFKTEFRLPMLVSLVTPEWEQDSMEDQAVYMFQEEALFEDLTFYHTGYVSCMLPELRMYQEMMENVLNSLGQPVIKGKNRPSRPAVNPSAGGYEPQSRAPVSELPRLTPPSLELGAELGLTQAEGVQFMQQMLDEDFATHLMAFAEADDDLSSGDDSEIMTSAKIESEELDKHDSASHSTDVSSKTYIRSPFPKSIGVDNHDSMEVGDDIWMSIESMPWKSEIAQARLYGGVERGAVHRPNFVEPDTKLGRSTGPAIQDMCCTHKGQQWDSAGKNPPISAIKLDNPIADYVSEAEDSGDDITNLDRVRLSPLSGASSLDAASTEPSDPDEDGWEAL